MTDNLEIKQTIPLSSRRYVLAYTRGGCYEVLRWNNLLIQTEHGSIPMMKIQNLKFITPKNTAKLNRVCHPVTHFGRKVEGTLSQKLEFVTGFPLAELLKKSNPICFLSKKWISHLKFNQKHFPLKTFHLSEASLIKISKSDFIQPDAEIPVVQATNTAEAGDRPPQQTKKKKKHSPRRKFKDAVEQFFNSSEEESEEDHDQDNANDNEDEKLKKQYLKTLKFSKKHIPPTFNAVPPFDETEFQLGARLKEYQTDDYLLAGSLYLNTLHTQEKLVVDQMNMHITIHHRSQDNYTCAQLRRIASDLLSRFCAYNLVTTALNGVIKLARSLAQTTSELLRKIYDSGKPGYRAEFLDLITMIEAEEIVRDSRLEMATEGREVAEMNEIADALTKVPEGNLPTLVRAREQKTRAIKSLKENYGLTPQTALPTLKALREKYPDAWYKRLKSKVNPLVSPVMRLDS